MSGIFRRLRRGSPSPGEGVEDRVRLDRESRRTAENFARGQASEREARSHAAVNEARRQVSDAEARSQGALNEARRQVSDAEARSQGAEKETGRRSEDVPPGDGRIS
jgi:hypothetical protein